MPSNFKVLLGDSLFVQDGEQHRKNRRLIMPAVHGPILAHYVDNMLNITTKYLEIWEKKYQFAWFFEFKQLTFEIASKLLLGSDPSQAKIDLSKTFTTITDGLFAINTLPLPFTTYNKAVNARKEIIKHLKIVIQEHRQNHSKNALSLLLQAKDEDGNSMSEKEIIDQCILMLFAGHDTSTAMLTWLCLELGRNPDILQRARDEQKQFSEDKLTVEKLAQMTYLEQILLEVERLHPPVGSGFRGVVKEFEFNGFHVPVDWQVLYIISMTHQLPEVYSEPQRFDPDRFGPERQEHKKHPMSLIGFGGGPRTCLGIAFAKMEMKIVASQLLRFYDWEILPNQNLNSMRIPTDHPHDGLKVKFYRR